MRVARRPGGRRGARDRGRRRRARPSGQILTTSTVQDLVAGSGIEFTERGSVTLAHAGKWRLFTSSRTDSSSTTLASWRRRRSGGGRLRRRSLARDLTCAPPASGRRRASPRAAGGRRATIRVSAADQGREHGVALDRMSSRSRRATAGARRVREPARTPRRSAPARRGRGGVADRPSRGRGSCSGARRRSATAGRPPTTRGAAPARSRTSAVPSRCPRPRRSRCRRSPPRPPCGASAGARPARPRPYAGPRARRGRRCRTRSGGCARGGRRCAAHRAPNAGRPHRSRRGSDQRTRSRVERGERARTTATNSPFGDHFASATARISLRSPVRATNRPSGWSDEQAPAGRQRVAACGRGRGGRRRGLAHDIADRALDRLRESTVALGDDDGRDERGHGHPHEPRAGEPRRGGRVRVRGQHRPPRALARGLVRRLRVVQRRSSASISSRITTRPPSRSPRPPGRRVRRDLAALARPASRRGASLLLPNVTARASSARRRRELTVPRGRSSIAAISPGVTRAGAGGRRRRGARGPGRRARRRCPRRRLAPRVGADGSGARRRRPRGAARGRGPSRSRG